MMSPEPVLLWPSVIVGLVGVALLTPWRWRLVRIRAAWMAFREPEREYWRGFRAARAPFLVVLRTLRQKHRNKVTISDWALMEMLWPNTADRQRIENEMDREDEEEYSR